MGSGAFPLRIEWRYNSFGNKNRTSHGLDTDPDFPTTGGPTETLYTESAPNNTSGFRRYGAEIPTDPQELLTTYTGNAQRKWRNYYDRYLVASFEKDNINPNDTPQVINLYRYDGEQEIYFYNIGAYEPQNAYKTKISRLDVSHPLAPGWEAINAANEREIYSLDGKLLQITAPSGLSHTLTYDPVNTALLSTIADDFGHTLQFFYEDVNDPALVTRITDPDGHDYRYTHTTRGLIATIVYPDETPGDPNDNPYREFQYNDVRFPDGITDIYDENGDLYSHYEYDDSGWATVTELGAGVSRFEIDYDWVANTRTETNDLGLESVFTLLSNDLISQISRAASPSGYFPAANLSRTYDTNGYRASQTDFNGNVTNYVHDIRGLEISRTEAVGTSEERTITTTWHPDLRLPTQIVEPGRTTDMTYDSNGNLLTRTETDTTTQSVPYSTNGRTRTWTYTYYAQGANGQFLVETVDGPRTDINDVTTYTYTPEGYVATITNPLGQVTQITSYNARGLPLTLIDSNTVTTQMTYHPRGWLLSSTVVDPVGSNDATTTYQYDNVGQLTRVTLPNGAYLDYEYDSAHRLTAISNNLNERQEYSLDDAGNITAETTRDGTSTITRTQTQVYDELSRIYQAIGGANQLSQMAYDDNGNQTTMALDPLGINQSTIQAFDALNRLVTVTDADLNDSDYGYDARDNLISVTDQRGLATTYTYDGLNNLIQLDSPDTGITIYTFDDAGNQGSQTDARGVVTNFSYDALNRLAAVTYPATPSEDIAYTYDQPAAGYGVGRLTQLTDQTGSTSYVYDHRGNQLQASVTIQGNAYTTAYAYDLADIMIQTTYPSGRVVNHQLDVLGRVETVTTQQNGGALSETIAENVSYLPFGPMQSLDYGNDLELNLSIDQDYRIAGLVVEDSNAVNPDVLDLTYTQNAIDNITDIVDAVDPTRTQAFNYDQLNRLISADGQYGLQGYSYDEVGNRLSLSVTKDGSTTTETYTYDTASNRLLSVDVDGDLRTFQYDNNGNIIGDDRGSDTGFNFQYNDQNRLIQATPQGGQ